MKKNKKPDGNGPGFWQRLSPIARFILIGLAFVLMLVLLSLTGVPSGVVTGVFITGLLLIFLLKGAKSWQGRRQEQQRNNSSSPRSAPRHENPVSTGMPDNSSRSRKRSSASVEVINPDDIDITMDDIAGNEEAKREIQQVLEFLKNPERLGKFGGKIPRGTLLFGPSGTGKTMLVKAVAKTSGRPFITPVSSSFAEMYVGVGPARVRELFNIANSMAPCIIFIDEIDALGKRGETQSGGDKEHNNTLNEILQKMDGISSSSDVIVFAATNLLENLDPALLRPGRFDRHIKIDLPDIVAREAIFEVHTKAFSKRANIKYKEMFSADVNLKSLARRTYGCSGADIANIVNEACIAAGDEEVDSVSMKHFIDSIDRVMTGTKRRNLLSEEERRRVACHETGHALVGYLLPDADNPNHITIVGRDKSLGHTMAAPEAEKQLYQDKDLMARLAVLVGGRIAEEITYPGTKSTGGGDDYSKANQIATAMVTQYGMAEDEELRRRIYGSGGNNTEAFTWSDEIKARIDKEITNILTSAEELAKETLVSNLELFEKFTEHLFNVETMDEDEIKKAVKKFSQKGPLKDKIIGAVKPTREKE